jgi:predicted transcriptional regulator
MIKKRRGHHELLMESLNAIKNENLVTNIMYEVRTSYPKIRKILTELLSLELVQFNFRRGTGPGTDAGKYSLTEKGKKLLEQWYHFNRTMGGS